MTFIDESSSCWTFALARPSNHQQKSGEFFANSSVVVPARKVNRFGRWFVPVCLHVEPSSYRLGTMMFARFWSTSDHATTSLQSSIPTCRAWSREVSSSLCVFSRRRDPPATRSRRRTTAGRRSKRAHRATNMPDSMPSPPIRVLSFLGATSTSFVHTTCTADCRTFLWGGTGEPIYDADRLCWCSCDSDKWSDANILGHPSCVPMAAHLTYGWIGLVVSVAALLHAAFHLRRQVITHKQGLVGFQVGYCMYRTTMP